ncbi:peptide-methionine (S)-S-oxide reductase [Muriicola sp. Z0-33]|uniref:peptide-methionine (S)-S-oxide reductase n=1 Tax=Muriicola sp. Z0-33 TaxID=2816957 RepID=UPI0022374F7C|nr:peptide-methionine (S)-S-oxide reductase [Muriicola sp. Z0-33]MCW5515148.1 peptide-methionine (S)-S-oxide reductase [Muriicola sp. Z0-33]
MERSNKITKIGLGGGCHWCTEAVYQSLLGVRKVEQGFITSINEASNPSEAVVVFFDPEIISLETLIEIHLNTHQSTSEHSFREKYRSAVYPYSDEQQSKAELIIGNLQGSFPAPIITKVLPFEDFRFSTENFHDYYYSNPDKPFCRIYINPKLQLLQKKFAAVTNSDKIRASIN